MRPEIRMKTSLLTDHHLNACGFKFYTEHILKLKHLEDVNKLSAKVQKEILLDSLKNLKDYKGSDMLIAIVHTDKQKELTDDDCFRPHLHLLLVSKEYTKQACAYRHSRTISSRLDKLSEIGFTYNMNHDFSRIENFIVPLNMKYKEHVFYYRYNMLRQRLKDYGYRAYKEKDVRTNLEGVEAKQCERMMKTDAFISMYNMAYTCGLNGIPYDTLFNTKDFHYKMLFLSKWAFGKNLSEEIYEKYKEGLAVAQNKTKDKIEKTEMLKHYLDLYAPGSKNLRF